MQHTPCGPGGDSEAPNPVPAWAACVCTAERERKVQRGCGGWIEDAKWEGDVLIGRAYLGTRPQDVSSFKLKGEGRPPCLKINK
nr:unnamed protein product [Camelus bactrianus]